MSKSKLLKIAKAAATKHEEERDAAENAWALASYWWAWTCWSGHGTRTLPIHGKGGCKRRWSQDHWQD